MLGGFDAYAGYDGWQRFLCQLCSLDMLAGYVKMTGCAGFVAYATWLFSHDS
jgi:hypothetical protein